MSLSMLGFARPGWLLVLLPLGFLVWRLWRAPKGSGAVWQPVVDAHLLPHLLVGATPQKRRTGFAMLVSGFILGVLALAGPALDQRPAAAYQRDATRVLVVDLSAQMATSDPAAPQLEQVRLKILDVLRALPDGQSALIAYAGEPYLIVPPTTDVATIALFVPELAVDAMPVPGNRPERALGMAERVLDRSASELRDVLWITAGADRAGWPIPELKGVRLSILHVATVDDSILAASAVRSGGTYVRMRADDADVRQLAAALAARAGWLATAWHGSRDAVDVGYWLLLPLLPLAALAFRGGLLALLLAPLLLAGLPQPAEASAWPVLTTLADYQAWRRLQSGDAAAAAEAFSDLRWRAVARYRAGQFDKAATALDGLGDVDSLYNRGNALARQGLLSEALVSYDAALKLRENDEDTRYNCDLVQRLLNERESQRPGAGGRPPPVRPKLSERAPLSADVARDDTEREGVRLAEQWIRRVPDEPGSLLRRKLQIEQRRRLSGEAAPAW